MNDLAGDTANIALVRSRARVGPMLLMGFHIVVCCLSLVYVAEFYVGLNIIMFDKGRFFAAALSVALFAIISVIFAVGRFSFGYFLGFYFYTMILGYLWLAEFSKFHYNHTLAAFSAFGSALAFLVPALFITSPVRQMYSLSVRALEILLSFILTFAAIIVAAGAFYNFRLVGVADIYNFRNELQFPAWLAYAMGATSSALLPFAFACFVARGHRWRAALALLLLLLFYPITLTKLLLFAPAWLLFLALLSDIFEARTSVVLSLFLPISAGVILALLFKFDALPYGPVLQYFGAINFRMIAFPSIALDVYSDFFSTHNHTYFCQISFLKSFMGCPYNEYLSIVMAKTYQLGNLNASLFATEGIASVGVILAPLAVLGCGLVIALVNRLSAGLPPRFVLLSGGILPQVFLNVPFTTTLLTNGAFVLILLWYVTPREIFEPGASDDSSTDDRPEAGRSAGSHRPPLPLTARIRRTISRDRRGGRLKSRLLAVGRVFCCVDPFRSRATATFPPTETPSGVRLARGSRCRAF